MCDRIAILNHGEVVACEDTPDLLAQIDSKTLLLRLAAPCDAPPDLGPEVVARMRAPDLLALTYPRRRVSAPALVAGAQAAGLEIVDLATEEPKLEEVFLTLTRPAAE